MAENSSLAKWDPKEDPDWQAIVEQIARELERDNQLPDNAVRATELLIAGWPAYKVAKELGVRAADIRRWLEIYPAMALAVSKGRKLMTVWRMAKLEQQFALAIEKSEEILDLELKALPSSKTALTKLIGEKEREMRAAASELNFELATLLRDEVRELRKRLGEGGKDGSTPRRKKDDVPESVRKAQEKPKEKKKNTKRIKI